MNKMIAEKIGVSQKTISNYLTGKTNSEKVENAILQALGELKEDKKQLLKKVYDQNPNN